MEDPIFEEIYHETALPLWRYVARISGNRDSADDILQETYLRFLRSPFIGNEMREIKPYLYKIATNLVYKRFNQSKRQTEWANTVLRAGEASHDVIKEEIEMTQLFSRLKGRERSLLWLAYVEGYGHREIAKILNINFFSVRVLLYRAKQRLLSILGTKPNE